MIQTIDYKTRRKLRQQLGSRVGRRAGTKKRRSDGTYPERPCAKLSRLIEKTLKERSEK